MPKLTSQQRGCLYLVILVTLLFVVPAGAFYWKFQKYFPNPSTRQIYVRGRVTDAATGKSVAEARVVVTVSNESGLKYFEQYFYGLTTNDQGAFVLETKTPIDVDWLTIDVCSSDDRTGSISVPTNIVEKTMEIQISPRLAKQSMTSYKHFTGQSVPWTKDDMEFIGESWDYLTNESRYSIAPSSDGE